MGIELVTDATEEPISLALAWAQCNIDPEGSPLASASDYWLEEIGIPSARRSAENFCGLAFAVKTYRLTLDAFPDGAIELKYPPLVSVGSVTYVDTNGDTQTVDAADYTTDKSQPLPWVVPVTTWPAAKLVANSVKVTYTVGYAPAAVDKDVLHAMLLLLSHGFKNRDATTDRQTYPLSMGVESMLRPYRVNLGMA